MLQRLCVAYQAGKPIDLSNAAAHGMLSVPLSLFHTDKIMRTGNKSDLVNNILESANVQMSMGISCNDRNLTHYVVDGVAHVYRISTQGLETYQLPSTNFDVVMDRYKGPSIKDGTGKNRSNQEKKERRKTEIQL